LGHISVIFYDIYYYIYNYNDYIEYLRSGSKLEDLNLERIRDPSQYVDERDYIKKKALKLYHMAWSGVTKYMRTICLIRSKPVEFPYLGVFVPFERSEGRDEASP